MNGNKDKICNNFKSENFSVENRSSYFARPDRRDAAHHKNQSEAEADDKCRLRKKRVINDQVVMVKPCPNSRCFTINHAKTCFR